MNNTFDYHMKYWRCSPEPEGAELVISSQQSDFLWSLQLLNLLTATFTVMIHMELTGHCWPEKNTFIPPPSVSLFVLLLLHRLHPIKLFNKHTAWSSIKKRESHLCCEVLWRRAADIIYIWSSSVVFVKWNNMCKQRENSREQRSHARHPVLHTWALEKSSCKDSFHVLCSSTETSSELLKPLNRSFLCTTVCSSTQTHPWPPFTSLQLRLKTINLVTMLPSLHGCKCPHTQTDFASVLGPEGIGVWTVFQRCHEVNPNAEFTAHSNLQFIRRYRDSVVWCFMVHYVHFKSLINQVIIR